MFSGNGADSNRRQTIRLAVDESIESAMERIEARDSENGLIVVGEAVRPSVREAVVEVSVAGTDESIASATAIQRGYLLFNVVIKDVGQETARVPYIE